MSNKVTYVSEGLSPILYLPQGNFRLAINATDWNSATAVLQESIDKVNFVASDNPYDTGNSISRTAAGPLLNSKGGCYYRLSVTGSPSNLTLEFQYSE